MGILETIKGFFVKDERVNPNADSIKTVKAAADASDYNLAAIRAFNALEEIGRVYATANREISTTAREYSQQLVETGMLTGEELEPIVYNFEVAKYSEESVTFDDYRTIESALDNATKVLKKGKRAAPRSGGKRKAAPKRRRKRKRTTGAGGVGPSSAARRRKARKKN